MGLVNVRGGARWVAPTGGGGSDAGGYEPGNHLTYTGLPLLTVWNRTGNPNPADTAPSQVGQLVQAYPAARDRSYLNSTAAEESYQTIVRQFWERRSGPGGAVTTAFTWASGDPYQGTPYTVMPSDAGKQIRVRETTTDKDGTSTAYSPWFSIASSSRDPDLVYLDDLTYLGAFRGPSGNDFDFMKYGGLGLAYDAAGNGGSGSLFMAGRYGWGTGIDPEYPWGEITIPTPVSTSSLGSLPIASFTARNPSPVEATEGQLTSSGIPNNLWRRPVGGIVYNSKLVLSANVGYATRTPATHWRRPLTLATTGQVEGPVWLSSPQISTFGSPSPTAREGGGHMCHVPAAWQSALGGPVMVGAVNYSLNQTMSHGPSAFTFDPDDIAGKTFISGTLPSQSGMTTSQIKLPAGVSGSLAGRTLAITGGPGFVGGDESGVFTISAWDDSTKVASITPPRAYSFDTTTTFKVFESIPSVANVFYPLGDYESGNSTALEDNASFLQSIFSFAPAVWGDATALSGMVIPHGTRALLVGGRTGNGFARYNNSQVQYDPQYPSTGPRAYPYYFRIWAFDLDDLAAVKAGTKDPWAVRPYAVWNMQFPISPAGSDVNGMCYDSANRRIFLTNSYSGPNGESIVHVVQVNNAVAT